jgi:hypothetical protein
MDSLISALYTIVVPIAVLAVIVGTVGGILFKKMDGKINEKISGRAEKQKYYGPTRL